MKRAVIIVLAGTVVIGCGFAILHRNPATVRDQPREAVSSGGITAKSNAATRLRKDAVSGPEARLKRVAGLAARGPGAIPGLAQAMDQATTIAEKEEFADVLVDIGTAEALQAFVEQWLRTESSDGREALAESLKGLKSDAGLEMVASILSLSSDPIVLAAVNDTLSRMADAETIAFLSELYEEGLETQSGLRTRVIDAVQGIANPGAVSALAELTANSESPELALAAADSLARIGSEAALTNLVAIIREQEASRELYEPLLERLQSVASPQSEAILATIAESDPSPEIRQAAAQALATVEAEANINPDDAKASAQSL